MASRSVALVNRLRLGEAPSAADCALAARLLALAGAAAGLADLAVPARVGEALDHALSMVADDCRRYQAGLADLLADEPDIDASLDFLSSVEADMGHALQAVLRSDFADGETPYRPGL